MIYLDNAATTKPLTEVVNVINNVLIDNWGNPSSLYDIGRKARLIVNDARNNVAKFIGSKTNEIIFTSGACEANALAIDGFLKKHNYLFVTSEIEHKSIINNYKLIHDDNKKMIKVDKYGFIDLELLEKTIMYSDKKCLVSIQWANNEIGTIQNMKEISKIVHKYNGVLHTDATQLIPDIPISVDDYGIDMMSFSGQKLHATKGIGVLYKKSNLEMNPIIYGSQESSIRGGTENVPYIAGLNEAINHIQYPNHNIRNLFIDKCVKQIDNCMLIGADKEHRLKNNASICFCGVNSASILYMLDQKNICVSVGSACNSDYKEASYVLKAIKIPKEYINSIVRFTFDNSNTVEEIDFVVEELKKIMKLLR